MCWVFGVSPSKTGTIKWTNSLRDIEVRTKLKVGENQARIVQDYQTLISVVSEAFGGGDKTSDTSAGKSPSTVAELTNSFNAVFGNGSR